MASQMGQARFEPGNIFKRVHSLTRRGFSLKDFSFYSHQHDKIFVRQIRVTAKSESSDWLNQSRDPLL